MIFKYTMNNLFEEYADHLERASKKDELLTDEGKSCETSEMSTVGGGAGGPSIAGYTLPLGASPTGRRSKKRKRS